jgi:hypothetical protein
MFANMKVVTRLALGFGAVIVLLVILSLLSIQRMGQVNDASTIIMEDRYPKVERAFIATLRVIDNGRQLRAMLLTTNEKEIEQAKQRVEDRRPNPAAASPVPHAPAPPALRWPVGWPLPAARPVKSRTSSSSDSPLTHLF